MTAERKVLYDAWKATPPCGQSTSADASECLRCLAKKALDAYDAEQLIIKQGGSPTEWMYLSDRVDSTSIINLDTGNILSTREVRVDGDCGLRRQRIEWVSHNIFRELPDFVPLTSEVATLLRKHGQHVNHWNMDPVCLPLEVQSDDPEWQETTKARIMDTLTLVPYEVELLGVQLRHLLYYSDGDYDTQQRYLCVAPQPNYNAVWSGTWELDPSITNAPTQDEVIAYTADEEDQTNPIVNGSKRLMGAPLLWNGPAIVVRLLLDGQQPAFGGCRIYLDPVDLRVISSDWCQRAGRDMYSTGIDLQVREYDLATWLISSCVPRAMAEGVFQPKSTKTKVVQLARIKKPAPIPSLEAVLKKHQSAVNRHLKTMSVDKTLKQLTADLRAENGPRKAELHKVPMCLVPEFTPETRELYAEAVSDNTILCNSESIGLRGYTKSPTVYVRAEYLMIDEARVRARAEALKPKTEPKKPLKPKGKVKTPKDAPTQEEVEARFLAMCGQVPQ